MTSDTAPKVMTFSPSKEEFKDFHRYVAYMESQGAHRAGMAKVIPPKDWKPRQSYEDIGDLVIPAPIQQVVTGQTGLFTQYNIQKKPMTVHEFRKTSGLEKFCHPRYADFEELERKFWKSLTSNPPLYGAEVSGTLYDVGVTEWNMARLDTILDMAEGLKGVNTPRLFFGMWKSAFAWHTEDMDLYNITYMHYGEPRSWYVVPPEHGKRLERLARGFFPGNVQGCEAFLRHKMTLMSPSILKKYGVPYEKVTQESRQFIVTFPFGYHAGFNHGFNCAESTNFATQRWIDYGKQAKLCTCRQDIVKISMDAFVRKFQPHRYKLWKAGKDHAPIDHTTPTPEAAEYLRPAEEDLKEKPREERRKATKHQHDAAVESPVGGAKKLCEQKKKKQQHIAAVETPAGGATPAHERQETHKVLEKKKAKPSHKQQKKKKKTEASITPEKVPEPVKVKPEPKKSRDAKPQTPKSHSKTTAKKTPNSSTNRRSPARRKDRRKDKNGSASVEACHLEAPPSHIQASPLRSEQGRTEDSEEDSSPPQHVFQRTLSPADVLHVHSYAKGDYTEGELPPPREDVKSDSSDSDIVVRKEERPPVKRAVKELPAVKRAVKDLPQVKRAVKDLPQVKRAVKDLPPVKRAVKELPPVSEKVKGASERLKGPEVKESHLGNLPHHHPLIKDGMSDEELSEEVQVEEEEGLEGESWARPLTHLWQNKPPNLKREREYNRRVGLKPPYCCICALFWSYHRTEDNPVVVSGGFMRTKPLIPEVCFTTITEEDSECEDTPLTPHLEEDGTSLLLSCSHCNVRVHTSCYGVNPAAVTKEWKCARCKANAMTEKCCLCSLRGGALQRANNNKWVHVMCAVAVLEARFVNITDRRPVDLSGIPLQRFKLKCYYCKKRMKKASGCCVQCSHGRCPTAYHPTCAQAAGVLMQPDEWPFMVYVTCCRHKGPTPIERNKAAMQELTVGQKVICKHKNGRYYQCDVVQLSKETFYEVNFDDGSFSDNLFPEDIVSRNCVQLGPPPQGEVVQVRWTDGLVYGAKFVAAHIIQMYLVEFEDGSQLTTKRDDVYTLDEELPKRVKSRLSKASDMRFDGIFEDKEIIQESKRQRVINSRYRGDYIEPVIYRAIME